MKRGPAVEPLVLQRWLAALDSAPLECDGMSRVIAVLLAREGIPHHVQVGAVTVEGGGRIDPHYWIALPDGYICDFRARMWLPHCNVPVPHGVFRVPEHCQYNAVGDIVKRPSPMLFAVLTGRSLESYPHLASQA